MYLFIRRVTGVYKQTNISLRASESFVGGDPTFGQIFWRGKSGGEPMFPLKLYELR